LELNKHRSLIQFMLFKEKNFSGLNKRWTGVKKY
jgi:hypothetical protein